tara:strand:- start:1353 stop:1595 length:243 start_codon:yes stop_codon:yes gene_type:complete
VGVEALKLPDWTKRLPADARLNIKEMSLILGYKNIVNSAVINKKLGLDNKDSIIDARAGSSLHRRKGWRVGDLRKIETKA